MKRKRRKGFKDDMYGFKFTTHKGNVYTFKTVNYISGRTAKIYNLHCNICSKDKVLWPHGSITASKGNVIKNKAISCGCHDKVSYKTFQWEIKINEHCNKYCPDYKLHSWIGGNLTFDSKLVFEKSGELVKKYTTEKFLAATELFKDKGSYGYYWERSDFKDYLYISVIEGLDYFKVGRSFEPERRLKENTRRINKYYNYEFEVETSYTFSSDHKTIFNLEQLLVGIDRDSLYILDRPEDTYGSSELIKNEYYEEVVEFCKDYIDEWWK